jgi:hypothetical protein
MIINSQAKETVAAKSNQVLQELMKVIKVAGESRSGLILNNVEIEFDYKYLYGNPLAN